MCRGAVLRIRYVRCRDLIFFFSSSIFFFVVLPSRMHIRQDRIADCTNIEEEGKIDPWSCSSYGDARAKSEKEKKRDTECDCPEWSVMEMGKGKKNDANWREGRTAAKGGIEVAGVPFRSLSLNFSLSLSLSVCLLLRLFQRGTSGFCFFSLFWLRIEIREWIPPRNAGA